MGLKQICKFEWLSYVKLAVIAPLILLGLSGDLSAAQNDPEVKTPTVVSQSTPDEPKLSEIIPLSAELSARLAKLENIKLGLPDLAAIKKDYSEIDERINAVSKKLESLRAMRASQNVRGLSLNMSFAYEKVRLNKINLPLEMAIERLDAWGREWQAEKQRWKDWQSSSLFKDRSYSQIRTTFEKTDATIDAALGFISRQMEPLLATQTIGAGLKAKIDGLDVEMTALQGEKIQREPLFGKTPPMYSLNYYAQFNRNLWGVALGSLKFTPRPGEEFFKLHALELGVLVFILLMVFAVIYRKRQAIAESENWSFVAGRLIREDPDCHSPDAILDIYTKHGENILLGHRQHVLPSSTAQSAAKSLGKKGLLWCYVPICGLRGLEYVGLAFSDFQSLHLGGLGCGPGIRPQIGR